MKISRWTTIAALSISALSVPASANNWWGGYHWATMGAGLSVKVNAALTSSGNWSQFVGSAVSGWDQPTAVLTLGTVKASSTSPKRCSPIAGEILICDEFYGQRGWLGIATIWNNAQGHIFQATTKLNNSYFTQARYNTPEWRAMVACQEIGHDFGLDHQDETFNNFNLGTCMDYTNAPGGGGSYGPSNVAPNQHDYDELSIIYSGNDGYTSAHSAASTNFGIRDFGKAPSLPPSAAPIGDSPAEWGYAVHADAQGRPDVFVRDLGRGQEADTHVFWAPETRATDIR